MRSDHGSGWAGRPLTLSPLLLVLALAGLAHADLESGNLVGRPDVATAGYTGDGITVAIIDSGIETNHTHLQGVPIEEACFCSADGGCCPNGQSTQLGAGAADDADAGEHGTISANLIASDAPATDTGASSNPGPGLAPDVSILAIRVFPSGSKAFQDEDVLDALRYIRDSATDVDVVAIGPSTATHFSGVCDESEPAYRDVVDQLTAAGVVVVAATGNDGDKSGFGAPACLSNAIAVGATWDGPDLQDPSGELPDGMLLLPFDTEICTQTGTTDSVACFSNSGPELDVLAPGLLATAPNTDPQAEEDLILQSASTAHAAAMVAGCAAAMLEADPSRTPDEVRQILTIPPPDPMDPRFLTDPGNNQKTPRLDCHDAVTKTAMPRACGNGLLETDEECEDGNVAPGDGCSDLCLLEPAVVVFDNGSPEQPAFGVASSETSDALVADDFMAPDPPATWISWYGAFSEAHPPGLRPADRFAVDLRTDEAGSPGAALQSAIASASGRSTGMLTPDGFGIYEYGLPFFSALAPGTTYWISIQNLEEFPPPEPPEPGEPAAPTPKWQWLASSTASGNGHRADAMSGGSFESIGVELSFALRAPEPSFPASTLAALMATTLLRRRRTPPAR